MMIKKKDMEYIFSVGHNNGLCSQKLFKVIESIQEQFYDIVEEDNHHHISDLLEDLKYCMELMDKDI